MSGYKPTRTFSANEGDYSVDNAGPDALEKDIDSLMAMFDPDATHPDGSPGGIGTDNFDFDFMDPSMSGKIGSENIDGLTSDKNVFSQLKAIFENILLTREESMLPKPITEYIVENTIDLNNVVKQGHYVLSTDRILLNAPEGFKPTGLIVERFRDEFKNEFVRQMVTSITSVNTDVIYFRCSDVKGTWSKWIQIVNNNIINNLREESMLPKPITEYIVENTIDLNNVVKQGHYVLSTDRILLNAPEGFKPTGLIVERFRDEFKNEFVRQMVTSITSVNTDVIYFRCSDVKGTWSKWIQIVNNNIINNLREESMLPKPITEYIVENTIDLNNVVKQGHYVLSTDRILLNAPEGFKPTGLIVERFRDEFKNEFVRQMVTSITSVNTDVIYFRCSDVKGTWSKWIQIVNNNIINNLREESMLPKPITEYIVENTIDLNNVVKQGHYVLSTDRILLNAPEGFKPTGLIVERFRDGTENEFVRQMVTSITSVNTDVIYFRCSDVKGTWSKWSLSKQEINYYNTYQTNQYNNTYSVTANPSITTDNLYILTAPDDGHDVTNEIETILNTYGTCRLGVGTFKISGIDMPPDTQLYGFGNKTILFLSNDIESGYAVKLRSGCRVSDLKIIGSDVEISVLETVGSRHGIMWEGDADSKEVDIPFYGSISNCYIEKFSGGGITCRNTGYSTNACLTVSDCYIVKCSAGINIHYFSEYHRFTNITCYSCWYGCINNGGNNMFSACNFSSNKVGVLFDNSMDQSPNNTHGSMVCCLLNHSDNNNGIAIKMLNCKSGYTFTGCQIFYGRIELVDSDGVIFADGIMKGDEYTITRGGSILFANCEFSRQPTFNVNENKLVRITNCFIKSTGEEVIINF